MGARKDWWCKFSEITDYSLAYLAEKLAWITHYWRLAGDSDGRTFAGDRAEYVLMFFDNPAHYDHLDSVAD